MSTQNPQKELTSRVQMLTARLLQAVSESSYDQIPALLEEQRDLAVLNPNGAPADLSDAVKCDLVGGIREALLLATVKRIHLNELSDACRRRTNTVMAYRCEPAGPSAWSSCG
jgi:hypothetical protein